MPAPLKARYFDGRTATAYDVAVRFEGDELTIEGAGIAERWPLRRLRLIERDAHEIRIGRRDNEDPRLVFAASDEAALAGALPDLISGRSERRRMTALIVSLIGVSALIAAGVFWGVPAISGPLAAATPKDLEVQMGENLAGQINLFFKPCKGAEESIETLAPMIDAMAEKGAVGFPITFQFVDNPMPNAFALPGGQVMATSGLLEATGEDQEAFLAVIAHELGHVRSRDGMQAIYRNAGAGVVLDIITGGSGAAQQAVLIAGQLNQLRNSRKQETAADDAAADILLASGLDPAALARAFEKIVVGIKSIRDDNDANDDDKDDLTWLSSHPDTGARIAAARARATTTDKDALLPEAQWDKVRAACES
jgi:Zn-dependent protease with chaperone function